MPTRLGVIRDFDLLPMLYPLGAGWTPTPPDFALQPFTSYAALEQALAEDAIDAALAPPTTYAALRDHLVIVSRPARVYEMVGNTPFLVSARRIDSSDTPSVTLSQTAPLGSLLFRLLADPYYGLKPVLSDAPDDAAALAAGTDGVVVGTAAGLAQRARADQLYTEARERAEAEAEAAEAAEAEAASADGEAEPRRPRRRSAPGESLYAEDLSKAWWIFTNNPLPLTLTLARRDWALTTTPDGLAITPDAVALADVLTAAVRQSAERMDDLVSAAASESGLAEETVRAHFAAQRYSFDAAARRGLTDLYSKAVAARLLPLTGLSIAELG